VHMFYAMSTTCMPYSIFSGFRAHFTRPKNLCPFFVPMIDEKSARVIKEMHVSRGKSSHSKVALHFILLLIYFFIVK
jgi:hypothetical protein